MSPLISIWTVLADRAGILDRRPGFDFDPDFYARTYDKPKGDAAALLRHFTDHGRAAGRHGTYYAQLRAAAPRIDAVLTGLVTDPALKALIDEDHPGALELAFELIQLGAPIDAEISDFSMQAYLDWHPDIVAARLNPLAHYLRFGAAEGGRRTLADLRAGQHPGGRDIRPDWPTVLICLTDLSDGDGTRPGLDLIAQASRSCNVLVAALGAGERLDCMLPHCCALQITPSPLREMPYLAPALFGRIDMAVLNSVEAALFVHPLVARQIPFAAYVHEDADSCAPWKCTTVAAFGDLLVFSSDLVRDSWAGRLADLDFDTAHDSTVIPPQVPLRAPIDDGACRAARQALSHMLGRDLTDVRLICGTGPVGWRKGTDIFVQAARICTEADPETVFIWTGDGLNHQDRDFGVLLDHQMRQAGTPGRQDNLVLLPAGPVHAQVIRAADALFLSSRLDPMPASVPDVLGQGGRVVCFAGATGFADPRHHGCDRITRVAPGDVAAAVRALLSLPRKIGTPKPATVPDPRIVPFDHIRAALHDRRARQRHFLRGETDIDIPLLFTAAEADRPLRRIEREKLFSYRRRLLWRDVEDARATLQASDNWVHRRLRLQEYRALPAAEVATVPFAIHVHAFYLDNLAADLRDHAAFAHARRILVTTDTAAKADRIRRIGADQGLSLETLLVPNQGRDILPFLRLFAEGGPAEGDGDDVWCHLHQKKSVRANAHGDVWRRFLHRILLGDADSLSLAIPQILDPGTGLVSPFEPHFVPWAEARRHLAGIADRFPGPLPDNPLLFPVGNMFWTRACVARRMLDLFGTGYPWPNEPIPSDGTEFHLIERLWPAVAAQMGLDSVFLHKMDEQRV